MNIYYRVLALLLLGAAAADGRQIFLSEGLARAWFIGLLVFDLAAATGLAFKKKWGLNTFIFLDCLELVVTCVFASAFSDAPARIAISIAAVVGYLLVAYKEMSGQFKKPVKKAV